MKWYNNKVEDIILSTRVRLARNLSDFAFAPKLNDESRAKMIKKVREAFEKYATERYNFVDMTTRNNIEKTYLVEEHMISRDFASMPDFEKRMLVYDENNSVSVMIGEEDHLRIQAVRPGFNIIDAYDSTRKVDSFLSKGVDFAFNEKLGYLTCCPSNTGTGMRISCMLHLPMITRRGHIKSIIEFCSRIGLAVRGFYGEGSDADGEIYQISNQVTLGVSEEETIRRISDAVKTIREKELELRNEILDSGISAYDKLWRSYGVLTNARCLSSAEFLSLWSDCVVARDLGLIDELKGINMMQLLIECMPAHIMTKYSSCSDSQKRDINRATHVREFIKNKKDEGE